MQTNQISLFLFIAAFCWTNGAKILPNLDQPKYFENDTVESVVPEINDIIKMARHHLCSAKGAKILSNLDQPNYFENDIVESLVPEINGSSPIVRLEKMAGVVSIQNRSGYHLCSGILISFKTALTLARCLFDKDRKLLDPSEIRLIADDSYITGEGSHTRQIREIGNYFIRSTTGIAMIEMLNPFVETETLKYTNISYNKLNEGDICEVVGWKVGWGVSSNLWIHLQRVALKIVGNVMANSSKCYDGLMPTNSIAAASIRDHSCFGDLGSALICDNAVSGILSFGCGRPEFPLIFYETYNDAFIVDNNRRGGGGGSSGGSIGGNSGGSSSGGTGGSNGGNIGGNNGGNSNTGSGNIIIIPPGNNQRECNPNWQDDCDSAGVVKLSLGAIFFAILQYLLFNL